MKRPVGRPKTLTPGQARAIFAFYHRDEATPKVLAKAYRTSETTVHRITSRQSYIEHTRDLWPLYAKDSRPRPGNPRDQLRKP